MSTVISVIQDKVQQLSPEKQTVALEFIDFLLQKQEPSSPPERPGMKLDWAGGLKELRDQYTSVELQKKANEWREEDALAH
jgi:Protein of unknown function (DUF2281)